jgi:hypothetical protein
MKINPTRLLVSLASTAALLTGSAHAANSFYDIGDLVLYFQKPGNNNTVYVSLGNAANNFRGAAAGSTADRQALNILNLNQTLTDAFGAGWASDTGIYAGAAAAHSSSTGIQILNGDQSRTMYVSRGRDSVGTVGLANSSTYDLNQAQSQTAGATNIIGMANTFEVNGTEQQQILTVDISTIDNQNPISNPSLGLQGTAFNAFAGGVQQRGAATTIGDFGFGGDIYAEDVEFALDIYRIVPRNDADTIGEVSGEKLVGSYEGTLTIGANGNVSFVTIPEPSSIALSGLAALGLAFRRRRNS